MRALLLFLLPVCLPMCPRIHAQPELVITSFGRNGELTWSNALVGGNASLEWAPSLSSSWRSDWSSLTRIAITSDVMTVSVPMFFRVVQRTYSPQSNGMQRIGYDAQDKAYWAAHSGEHPNGYGSYQKDGPEYTYYMSALEITNEEICEFLNDAHANPSNARGANMFFSSGNVFMDSSMRDEERLFQRAYGRLTYDGSAPVGSRYSVSPDAPSGGGSYSNHPATGVSWYGALKYCNWLTVAGGRGEAERCYGEGQATVDWAPVTAMSWDIGLWTDEERQSWLGLAGFRLPMTGEDFHLGANPHNELYKAAAWNGVTNMPYAFGRTLAGGRDMNYRDSGDPFDNGTTPVGFYDGSDHGGLFLTRPNENGYGVFDLSGNLAELVTEAAFDTGHGLKYRYKCMGGHYEGTTGCETTFRGFVEPSSCAELHGFHVVSTHP